MYHNSQDQDAPIPITPAWTPLSVRWKDLGVWVWSVLQAQSISDDQGKINTQGRYNIFNPQSLTSNLPFSNTFLSHLLSSSFPSFSIHSLLHTPTHPQYAHHPHPPPLPHQHRHRRPTIHLALGRRRRRFQRQRQRQQHQHRQRHHQQNPLQSPHRHLRARDQRARQHRFRHRAAFAPSAAGPDGSREGELSGGCRMRPVLL